MPKFKVFLQQYVEQVAVLEIEADDPQEARDLALNRASEANWQDGDDMYAADVYCVKDMNNNEVWERDCD
jgi:hypothetical protein